MIRQNQKLLKKYTECLKINGKKTTQIDLVKAWLEIINKQNKMSSKAHGWVLKNNLSFHSGICSA